MPLHSKKRINSGIVALWHITESREELIDMMPKGWLNDIDLIKVTKHNLAARVLAHTVSPEFEILEKDDYGKPYFESANHSISLTHTGEYAGFVLKKDDECGIDMEQITTRIERIQSKFVREDESEFLQHKLAGLYMIWCVKEALYKYYGLKQLDFKKHMKVNYKPIMKTGQLTGRITKGDYDKTVHLEYEFFDQYLLVYTI